MAIDAIMSTLCIPGQAITGMINMTMGGETIAGEERSIDQIKSKDTEVP